MKLLPLQKKEFDAAVAAICSEELLRILSDPTDGKKSGESINVEDDEDQ